MSLAAAKAATLTWTGAAGDGNVANAGNWSPAQAPTTGDTLIFAGSTSLAPQRSANLSLAAISFAAGSGAFTLGGNGVYTLTSAYAVTNNSSNLETINNGLTLGVAQTWNAATGALAFGGAVNTNGFGLTIDGSYNTTISSVVSGAGGLTKNGSGTLTLSGSSASSFSGVMQVNAGTVILAKSSGNAIANALTIGDGTGTDTVQLNASNQINNKTVTLNSSGVLNLNNFSDAIGSLIMNGGSVTTGTGMLTLGGNITTNANASSATISGNMDLGANRTFTVADGSAPDDLVISANINSGAANLTKAGAGTLVLSGTNALHGIAITQGVINVRSDAGLGGTTPTVSAGAALQLQNNVSIANALSLNGSGVANDGALRNISGNNSVSGTITFGTASTIGCDAGTLTLSGGLNLGKAAGDFVGAGNTTVSGVISTTGSVTMDGSGVLTLSGVNTYSGGSTINSGTIAINSSSSLGAITAGLTINAGTLEVTSTFSTTRAISLGSSSSTFQIDAGQSYTNTTAISGSGSLNKTGAGAMIFGAAETYAGSTIVSAGTLQLGASNQIPNASVVTVAGGTLSLQTYSDTVGGVTLAGGSITGTGGATLTNLGSYSLQSGSASAILAGSGALTKTTSGTVTLSATNAVTGAVTVSGGTLILANTSGAALGSTSGITVNSGGTLLLGASDQINNSAGLTLAGGTFAKGNFSEGATNAVGLGALTLTASGSHLDFGTGMVGALSFLNFNPNTYSLIVDNWTGTPNMAGGASTDRLIFDSDQTANLSYFSFTGYGAGAREFSLGSGFYEVVPLTAVPEPATYFAGGVTSALIVVSRRRWLRARLTVARKAFARGRVALRS